MPCCCQGRHFVRWELWYKKFKRIHNLPLFSFYIYFYLTSCRHSRKYTVNCRINNQIQFFIISLRHKRCCIFIRNDLNKAAEFFIPQNIMVGAGTMAKLPECAKKLGGSHAMLISGPTLRKMGIVAKNDGLTVEQFVEWFFGESKSNVFEGVVLQFTSFRY